MAIDCFGTNITLPGNDNGHSLRRFNILNVLLSFRRAITIQCVPITNIYEVPLL